MRTGVSASTLLSEHACCLGCAAQGASNGPALYTTLQQMGMLGAWHVLMWVCLFWGGQSIRRANGREAAGMLSPMTRPGVV